jgi:hypothetical protein
MSGQLGLRQPEIHWLFVPRQAKALGGAAYGHKVSFLSTVFGHSFLLVASKG